mmetsp:Transcript_83359/g.222956  ORF Transcript_83359/g.222956 Transcript_83359/m.222956 type:complete len:224 (-) Transcript_83359:613-1284(-)
MVNHQHPGPPAVRLVRPRCHQLAGPAHDLEGSADHHHLRPLPGLGEGHLERCAVAAPAQGPPAGLGDVRGEAPELRSHLCDGLVPGGAEDHRDAVGGELGANGSAEGCHARGVVCCVEDVPSPLTIGVHLKPTRRRLHLPPRLPAQQRQHQPRQPQGRGPVQLPLHLLNPRHGRGADLSSHAVQEPGRAWAEDHVGAALEDTPFLAGDFLDSIPQESHMVQGH